MSKEYDKEAVAKASVEAVFDEYVKIIEDDHESKEKIRDELKDLEQNSREVVAFLQKIHQPNSVAKIPSIVAQVKDHFGSSIRPKLTSMSKIISGDYYYKYHGMFSFSMQKFCFAACFTHYLETGELLTKQQVASKDWLDVAEKQEQGKFHLDLEDYLSGLIQMSNELARFSVNSVTAGDYNRPVQISTFLNDLLNGFRLLNLKNDNLRKRFDSLKYDLKKVEEVVYDLSIRGLLKEDNKEEPKEVKEEAKGE